ncbi:MAG: trypsin-like peptidase domain-containing protein [Gracilibacteraceae bacterium]|jgi:serine protease Do|nr:trypsin-like peptidase domain-containing protein [Gracilibacteraceae bacterium]
MSKKAIALLTLFFGCAIGLVGGLILAGALALSGGVDALSSPDESAPPSERAVVAAPVLSIPGASLTVPEIAAKNAAVIVEINTETMAMGGWIGQYISEGAGSGVIISADGYIATNNHVAANANKITVRLSDGQTYEARLISSDQNTDIAVLKIEATGLTPAVFGDSSQLRVGDLAVVIGNPLGQLGGTVTSGIISALDRSLTLENQSMRLLQTDAAVNPGNSGGGLFNARGELVGIVVAKSAGSGIEGLGFAIPVNEAKPVIESLMTYGYVKGRVYLGVNLSEVSAFSLQPQNMEPGLYVAAVLPNSPAERAGFLPYDRIIRAGDTEISDYVDLQTLLRDHAVGDELVFRVIRDGSETTLRAVLGEYAPEPQNNA